MGLESGNSGVAGSAIPESKGNYMAIAAFTAVAWYNIAELNIQVFLTFKRHRGLYFWSLLISGYGCVLHALGFLLKFFQLTTNNWLSVTIITVGWYAMVTGQAVVLYSRLHLVVREQRVLRGVLAMIIVDAICFHIPTTVLTYGTNSFAATAPKDKYLRPFGIVEKLQMTAFCIQEFIISGIYVWSTIRLLRPVYHGRTRKVMMQLIWINLIIIAMDVVLLAMEYSNIYYIEATLKAMVYSIKLKLEFAVLNQLMTLANSSVNSHQVLEIENGEKPSKPPTGRSKSTEYISSKYEKPNKRPKRTNAASPEGSNTSTTQPPPPPSRGSSYGQFGQPSNNKNHFQWVPTLDRHCVVETKHVENASVKSIKSNDQELNMLNNPAAHFTKPAKRSIPQDKYGVLEDDEDDDIERMLPPPPKDVHPPDKLDNSASSRTTSNSPRRGRGSPQNGRRRAPPPPSLNFDQTVMPNGLIRSNRPSVSEWGRGPDSETSPESDELQLNPCTQAETASPVSPGSVKAARQRASQRMGLDFMTSALR